MNRVYSITIDGANDCVVMTEAESALIVMKFGNRLEMYDMTARHGLQPEHLHKLKRLEDAGQLPQGVTAMGPVGINKKGVGPGKFGGAANMMWEFQDLMEMEI